MEVEATVSNKLPDIDEMEDLLVSMRKQFKRMEISREEEKNETLENSIAFSTMLAIEEQNHVNFAIIEEHPIDPDSERGRITQELLERQTLLEQEAAAKEAANDLHVVYYKPEVNPNLSLPDKKEKKPHQPIPDQIYDIHELVASLGDREIGEENTEPPIVFLDGY